jgi:hypothetical protein
MNSKSKQNLWTVVFTLVFITLVFAITSSAQKPSPVGWEPSNNPYDFTNLFYAQNGVIGRQVEWRRTGADGLSIFDKPSWAYQRNVRVIVTVPAYNESGEPYFWYPLGEVANTGFTGDETGFYAREMGKLFPIYVFPDEKYTHYNTIANTRQAPLMDTSLATYAEMNNPLGIRKIFLVYYTPKAHGPEGLKMMAYMAEKNGFATDSTPIIKSMEDLRILKEEGFITFEQSGDGDGLTVQRFALSPILTDPTNGVIAKDAFLRMSSRDGKPLSAEMNFVTQFDCLQALHTWCMK